MLFAKEWPNLDRLMRPPKSPIGFYAAALEAGGNDNGPPGIREHYGPNYYSAFVFDPDGNNIEAVCRKTERNITRNRSQ